MRRIVLPLMLFVVACQPATMELTDADLAAIRSLHDSWVPAITGGDFDALAALYTENTVVMPPNQSSVEGRAAVRAWMEASPPITEATLSVAGIVGYGDLAVVRGTYSMTIMPEGAPEPIHDRGKFIEIRRRQPDGSWLMEMDIYNSDLPLPSTEGEHTEGDDRS